MDAAACRAAPQGRQSALLPQDGLDDKTLARSRRLSRARFGDRQHLTRTALGAVLARAGIKGGGLRLAYLMMDAEIDHVICSGPRQGKQFTYALVDERAAKPAR